MFMTSNSKETPKNTIWFLLVLLGALIYTSINLFYLSDKSISILNAKNGSGKFTSPENQNK